MARRLPDRRPASGKQSQPAPPAARPTVLLTGFEPFDGADINPSWQIAQALHGRQIAGHRVQALCLPTAFGQSLAVLRAALRDRKGAHAAAEPPRLCVALGQAGGRDAISLERVAINVDDARIADNAGASPVDLPVVPGAPAAYFSTLPIKAMREAVLALGLPAEVSQTAGTFVCNHVFYGLMHELATRRALRATRGGFIHVPWLPQQCPPGAPSMPLHDMVRAVQAALRCALQTTEDLRAAAGATH